MHDCNKQEQAKYIYYQQKYPEAKHCGFNYTNQPVALVKPADRKKQISKAYNKYGIDQKGFRFKKSNLQVENAHQQAY